MTDKHYAFVDRKCPKCNESGSLGSLYKIMCPECHGTGIIGSCDEMREQHKIGMETRGFKDYKGVNNE